MDPSYKTDGKSFQKRLLIIDDEENMRHMLTSLFRGSAYRVDTAPDGYEGLKMVGETVYDYILCDIKMPRMDGIAFLKSAGDKISAATVIMMSAYGSIDTAVEAMKLGAYDFISKPFKADEVRIILRKAEERDDLKKENLQLKKRIKKIRENYSFHNMVGKSSAMQSVFRLAEKVSQYNSTVLITGESGTGKELIARGIHFHGAKSDQPFVPVNCGGIPETLLESELFGYKKGAFTGADKDKKGLFEEAEGGTIVLDEIGELPSPLQVKLLRVLQESEIRPVGASKIKKIDVRVIASTAKNIEDEIRKGSFREDLYYRLNVIRIEVPPLRSWAEDIPLLTQHFINIFNEKFGKKVKGVLPAAMPILLNHKWPGNVRELENVIERAVLLAEDTILMPEHFSIMSGKLVGLNEAEEVFEGYSLKAAQKVLEKKFIKKALAETSGNRTKASRILEISHPSLLSKMKAYNITDV